jgi:signal transduction histidine kinase/FixJ family two-component response regulator
MPMAEGHVAVSGRAQTRTAFAMAATLSIVVTLVVGIVLALMIEEAQVEGLGPAVRELASADFIAAEQATPPDAEAAWAGVALPDDWVSRHVRVPGSGWYRFGFELDEVPEGMLGLGFSRIGPTRTVFVNGRMFQSLGRPAAPAIRATPALIELPPALLQPGRNVVLVHLVFGAGARAGLSVAEVGPLATLRIRFDHRLFWFEQLPRLLNGVAAALAAIMLLIWLRRRNEMAIGTFGGLFLIVSARNYLYSSIDPLHPGGVFEWLAYCAIAFSTALIGWFALAITNRRSRPYSAALWLSATALPVLAGVLNALGFDLATLRHVSYPLLAALDAVAAWLIYRSSRSQARNVQIGLALGLIGIVLTGAHDYLYLSNLLPLSDLYWLPYVTPVVFAAFGLGLVNRVVAAMGEVERLNVGLEDRVAQRTRQLEAANAAKTRFLAAASHDLRQPIHAVGLLVGVLRETIRYPAVSAVVERIQASVEGIESLLKGLLDISKLDAGGVRPALQDIALAGLFEAIALIETPAAQAKGLRLRVARTGAVVHTDPELLGQILHNLVANAVRYTERGGVLLGCRRVRCNGRAALRIEVHDTGIGIPAEAQPQLYEEFFRIPGPQLGDAGGLGLGLAIVQRTAQLLQAPLSLRSQLGVGTCFGITVPLAFDHMAAPSHARKGEAEPMTGFAGSFIAVIEDDAQVRYAMAKLLESWGCRVVSAAGARALLAELEHHLRPPDLLISDYRLLGAESGLEAIALVRRELDEPGLPALVITGDTEAALRILRSSETGASLRVLQKPVPHGLLHAELARLLLRAATASAAESEESADGGSQHPAPSARMQTKT